MNRSSMVAVHVVYNYTAAMTTEDLEGPTTSAKLKDELPAEVYCHIK